ncbi:MAG: 2-oxoglutarate dehydrogenase E1 component [Kofleriaceae bacterium]
MSVDVLDLSGSLAFIDEMYERFLADPGSVDPSWAAAFAGRADAPIPAGTPGPLARNGHVGTNGHAGTNGHVGSNGHAGAGGYVGSNAHGRPSAVTLAPVVANPSASVWPLVNAYRSRGHLAADLDPLGLVERVVVSELEPATWGLTDAALAETVSPTGVHGLPAATGHELLAALRETYCGPIGVELAHIDSPAKRTWVAQRMETRRLRKPDVAVRRRMLEQVVNAEGFERFCHVKYPGTKRFSLEGSEAVIPALDLILTHGARLGAIEAVIGMAHRGRLTTLEQIMQRAARDIFAEFEDIEPEALSGGGDVKYHQGFSSDRIGPNGNPIHLSLSFNPSHLEAVDPVVVGRVRAKQKRHGDFARSQVMGILIHGDAAFAGQGLVTEVLQLHNLAGYRTGGTVHVIVNNQVGFTASPTESRSTPYATDPAHMIQCPIWHVNGDDLDAVADVVEMAMDYRAEFSQDVVIDLYCYRKYGHNESDEPSFTQPLMYERIQQKASVVERYGQRLVEEGVVSPTTVAELAAARAASLTAELAAAKSSTKRPRNVALTGLWRGYIGGPAAGVPDVDTGVPVAKLGALAERMVRLPDGFTAHPKVVRLLEQRAQMGRGERPLDWGMAEMLSYASLLVEGHVVRLSGQDCGRGTFSHRHAILTDAKTGVDHLVLGGLDADQGMARVYDSPLSEAGVLGFEFGFSLDYPDALVLWEAQFGDFANGAQVIIDQFITSCEDKWNRLSGMVMLLPHGYEGQGPEHSSARLERFLQSCAEDNIQVVQPTTPAQMFHLLRRQVKRPWRKPLIVMTPKSLLRLPAATSTLAELSTGTFERVIADPTVAPAAARRVLLCTGKIYYELVEARAKRGDATTAIVRVEQLYPLRPEHVQAALAGVAADADVAWVQDEPGNMGAATFIVPRLAAALGRPVRLVCRDDSASPATGSHKAHALEFARILTEAFG